MQAQSELRGLQVALGARPNRPRSRSIVKNRFGASLVVEACFPEGLSILTPAPAEGRSAKSPADTLAPWSSDLTRAWSAELSELATADSRTHSLTNDARRFT